MSSCLRMTLKRNLTKEVPAIFCLHPQTLSDCCCSPETHILYVDTKIRFFFEVIYSLTLRKTTLNIVHSKQVLKSGTVCPLKYVTKDCLYIVTAQAQCLQNSNENIKKIVNLFLTVTGFQNLS